MLDVPPNASFRRKYGIHFVQKVQQEQKVEKVLMYTISFIFLVGILLYYTYWFFVL